MSEHERDSSICGSVDAETAWEIIQEDIPILRQYCEEEVKGRSDA